MATFKKGDKVKCSAEYNYDNSKHLASFVRVNTYEVIQVGGRGLPDDRIVIGINGQVTAAVKAEYLTNISNPETPTPPTPPAPAPDPPQPAPDPTPIPPEVNVDEITDKILKSMGSGSGGFGAPGTGSGGGVQMADGNRPSASNGGSDGVDYNANVGAAYTNKSTLTDSATGLITRADPSVVQNAYGFPRSKGFDSSKGYYRYDYYQNYEADGLMDGLSVTGNNSVRRSVNIDVMSRGDLFKRYSEYYNRYKLANLNDILAHSFGHVFFVRPDCNIFATSYSGGTLAGSLDTFAEFYYAKKHAPELLRQLTQGGAEYNHELMPYLSNRAETFEVSDEYITSNTYGDSLTGYKIPYGKTNIESRTAGKFSIMYHDDRDLHVYHLHRLWTNYISYLYRGKIYPRDEYIMNKILDYPTCVYYILTAEDGETVIFWSKYWGVFPLEAPSSGFSFTKDNAGGVFNPELKIEYQYAWKEDFNPITLLEFNQHTSRLGSFRYIPSYQNAKLGTGYTWSGMPFVETMTGNQTPDLPYTFKLRFRQM